MKKITPPWVSGPLAKAYGNVRPEYEAGVWAYAVGTPAQEHERYDEAMAVVHARAQGKNTDKPGRTRTNTGAGKGDSGKAFNPWWIRSLSDVDAALDGCWMDEEAGKRVCDLASKFLFYPPEEGGGNVKLLDWQVYDFIVPLFGWMRPNGFRRFLRGTVWVPKKNGKSFICSLLALYGFLKDNEPAPEVYTAAGDRDQAAIIYDESSHLAKASPAIARRVRFVDSQRRMFWKKGRGKYRVLSNDSKLAEGLKWSMVLFDELHVQTPAMWRTLKGGGVSRNQPMMLAISTAGIYDETGIGWNQWELCEKIQSGAVRNWSYFTLIYRGDADGEIISNGRWHDEDVWIRANPSYGAILRPEIFKELHAEAVANPSEQSQFFRYHLNIWTRASEVWIDQKEWRDCGAEFSLDNMQWRRAYGGMDLSLEDDLTAFALWFPPDGDDEYHRVWTWFWLPKMVALEKAERNAAPYDLWLREGHVFGTEGNVIDYRVIKAFILETVQKYDVPEIAYDRYQATQIVTELMDEGLTMVPHGQGSVSMHAPITEFKKLVRRGEVRHPNNPVLNWQISNCQIVHDSNGNVKLKKSDKTPGANTGGKGYKRYKIDGVIAAVMGLSRAIVQPDVVSPGIVVI